MKHGLWSWKRLQSRIAFHRYGYAVLFSVGLFHLFTYTEVGKKIDLPMIGFLSGFAWLFLTHLYFQSLQNRMRRMGCRIEAKNVEIEREATIEKNQITHVLPLPSTTIKVVFSSENAEMREKIAPWLKDSFQKETKAQVEVIALKNWKETLCAVTDNVIDLVILSDMYSEGPAAGLCAAIKDLDRNIPVVVFSDRLETTVCPESDGSYSFPQERKEVKPLATYVRKAPPKPSPKSA